MSFHTYFPIRKTMGENWINGSFFHMLASQVRSAFKNTLQYIAGDAVAVETASTESGL